MTKEVTIFWFRQDLRISDNPGLFEAAGQGDIMPIYIFDPATYKLGTSSKWWLQKSLGSLKADLSDKLNFYIGNAKQVISKLIKENNVSRVYWSRCYDKWSIERDAEIETLLKPMNIECKSFNASLIWEPWEILKDDNSSYKVFTPFYKRCLKDGNPRDPLPRPNKMNLIKDRGSDKIDLGIGAVNFNYKVGEQAAQGRLLEFLDERLYHYKDSRNYPARPNISKLSPHLHFGEISPHQVWKSAVTKGMIEGYLGDLESFLSELGWREFSNYLLYHFPELPCKNYQAKFDKFPWQDDNNLLEAWQNGKTGYPIIDAGMRELLQTGQMHNRVRMIVASFLVKNLLIDWRKGADWFLDKLVDADIANNSMNWQWIAGSGVDAAPYFRIFNPVTQGEKFDSSGEYTRNFVPELNDMSDEFLFKPWDAPEGVLKRAGVILGKTYYKPIVDLKSSRSIALQGYRNI